MPNRKRLRFWGFAHPRVFLVPYLLRLLHLSPLSLTHSFHEFLFQLSPHQPFCNFQPPLRESRAFPTQGTMAHLLFITLSQSSRLHLDSFFSFCLTFSISVSSPKYTQILPPFFQNKAQSPTLPFTITSSISHRLPVHGPGRGAAVTWQPCIPMSPHPLPAPPAFLLHGRPWPDLAGLVGL